MKKITLLLVLITTPIIAFGSQGVKRKKKQDKKGVAVSNWEDFEKENDTKRLQARIEKDKQLQMQHLALSMRTVYEQIIRISNAEDVESNIQKAAVSKMPVDQTNMCHMTALQWISTFGARDRATNNKAIKALLKHKASISTRGNPINPIYGRDALQRSLTSSNNYNAARILSGHESIGRIINRPVTRLTQSGIYVTTYLTIALTSSAIPIKDRAIVVANFLKAGARVDEKSIAALTEHHGVSTSDVLSCRHMLSRVTLDLLQKAQDGPVAMPFRIILPNTTHCLCDQVFPRCILDILRRAQDVLADRRIILLCLEAEIKKYHEVAREAFAQDRLLPKDLFGLVLQYVS